MRTSLSLDCEAVSYPAQRLRHSARAADRFSLKNASAGETAFLIEMAIDGGVDRCEFLKTSHPPEKKAWPVPVAGMADANPQLGCYTNDQSRDRQAAHRFQRRTVGSQRVGDEGFESAVPAC